MIRTTSLFAAAAALLLAPGVASSRQSLLSEKQELQAGRDADAQIRRERALSADEAGNALVRWLGVRLAKVSERTNINWVFRVIEDKEVNALSVPGFVYVNTGLLKEVGRDQDALAGVIAHEIGHTTGRHARKRMEKALIGGLLGSLLAGRNSSKVQVANLMLGLVMNGYSRSDEYDADKRATRYAMAAGYDPNGMIRFFEILAKKEGGGSGGVGMYFRTHPNTQDRIKRIREQIGKAQADATVDGTPRQPRQPAAP